MAKRQEDVRIVVPGNMITADTQYLSGHGTYFDDKKCMFASLAGTVQRVNKLIYVKPLKTRYFAEVGDVVIGRVISIDMHRWKVNINARQSAYLTITAMNLPGGEQRIRQKEDELTMRSYLRDDDLICAEIKTVNTHGNINIHTRNAKCGKLGQGILIQISPSLIQRRKQHVHSLPMGLSLIIGLNGWIWIYSTKHTAMECKGFAQNCEPIDLETRQKLARLANCIKTMANHNIGICVTSILAAYEVSRNFQVIDLLFGMGEGVGEGDEGNEHNSFVQMIHMKMSEND
ncbi:hypothetical protein SNEBB_006714 [Seison nebaliae]|nr:hypothetical protein SNEBB_006714 [Seison nebaliae]